MPSYSAPLAFTYKRLCTIINIVTYPHQPLKLFESFKEPNWGGQNRGSESPRPTNRTARELWKLDKVASPKIHDEAVRINRVIASSMPISSSREKTGRFI